MPVQNADGLLLPVPLRLNASARAFIEETASSANFCSAEEVVEFALVSVNHHLRHALQETKEQEEAGASLADIHRGLNDSQAARLPALRRK